jgi:hypothetical protein
MADGSLRQAEADSLFALAKSRLDERRLDYPSLGGSVRIPLISLDGREAFFLDLNGGRINRAKMTYQNRARQVIILARLDVAGPAHRNPDGAELPCPHLHLYREGFGDKWAVSIPIDRFPHLDDLWETLQHFMVYCNIKQPPLIDRGLF